MIIQRPKRWLNKPPIGAQINWSDPITQGMIFDFGLLEGAGVNFADTVTNYGLTGAGNFSWTPTIYGMNYAGGSKISAKASIATGPKHWDTTTLLTLQFLCRTNATASAYLCIRKAGYWFLALNASAQWSFTRFFASGNCISHTTSTAAANTWYNLFVTFDGSLTAANQTFWINGVSEAGSGTNGIGGIQTDSVGAFVLGADTTGTPAQGWNGVIVFGRAWRRMLAASEILALTRDPFAVYVPQAPTNRIWFPSVSASVVDLPTVSTDDLNSGPWLDAAIFNASYEQLATDTLNVPWTDALLLNESYLQPASDSFTLTDGNALNQSYEQPGSDSLNFYNDSLATFGAWFFSSSDTLSITDDTVQNLGYWIFFNDSENNWSDAVAAVLGAAVIDQPIGVGDLMLFTDDNGTISLVAIYGPSVIDLAYLRRYLNDVINGGIDINL